MDTIQGLIGKTVLVTGATGLVGSNLVNRLLQAPGCHVIAMGRSLERLKYVFDGHNNNQQLSLVEHDVSRELPQSLGTIDFIFNTAGPIGGSVINNNPVELILSNIMGTINCLEYIKTQRNSGIDRGKVIVFSSVTASVSSEKGIIIEEQASYLTDSIDSSVSPYSQTKRMVEVIAKSYWKEYMIPSVVVRLSYVYGFSRLMPNTAVFSFIQKVASGQDIELLNEEQVKRDNIFIDDAIEGILAIGVNGNSGESYNISSSGDKGNYASMLDFANAIVQVMNKAMSGHPVKVIIKKEPHNIEGYMYSNAKMRAVGGV